MVTSVSGGLAVPGDAIAMIAANELALCMEMSADFDGIIEIGQLEFSFGPSIDSVDGSGDGTGSGADSNGGSSDMPFAVSEDSVEPGEIITISHSSVAAGQVYDVTYSFADDSGLTLQGHADLGGSFDVMVPPEFGDDGFDAGTALVTGAVTLDPEALAFADQLVLAAINGALASTQSPAVDVFAKPQPRAQGLQGFTQQQQDEENRSVQEATRGLKAAPHVGIKSGKVYIALVSLVLSAGGLLLEGGVAACNTALSASRRMIPWDVLHLRRGVVHRLSSDVRRIPSATNTARVTLCWTAPTGPSS
ncbi:MAG: hypothetical protein ACYTHJ_21210 [Planctomycetota bacterium]|jgi:hypothetical protein